MDLQTFETAQEIMRKLATINGVIELMTSGNTESHKFKSLLGTLVKDNETEFFTFVNNLHVKYETEFNDLHCACEPTEDDENSTEQENPKL